MDMTLGEHRYRIGRLDAFTQLFIVRRLLPGLGKLTDYAGDGPGQSLALAAEAFASLRDEDMRYIVDTCLEAVERRQPGGGWAPLRSRGALMYDMGLADMLRLSYHVMAENLRDFFAAAPFWTAADEQSHPIFPDDATER